jgi:hypothetical protein
MMRIRRLTWMVFALATGAVVSVGCSGEQGPAGEQGPPGLQGPTGQLGQVGSQGPAGQPGQAGSQGPAGQPGQAGSQGPAGEDGKDGKPADDTPSISALTPRKAFLGRTIDVTISGVGTEWISTPIVDFGSNIDIKEVIVASPTSIIATIALNETVALGARDVTVTDGLGTVTYKGAFKVDAPLTNPILNGTVAQGSILVGRLDQKDLSTPFDTAHDPSNAFANLSVTSGSGVDIRVDNAQNYAIDFKALVDVNAAAADTDIRVTSGPSGDTQDSLAPQALKIAARTPGVLSSAGPVVSPVTNAFDSALFAYTSPGKGKVVTIDMSWTSIKAQPTISLLPESGRFQDAIVLDDTHAGFLTQGTEKYYIVLWDGTGEQDYSVTLTLKDVDSEDAEPNDTCSIAQTVASLPATLQGLSLSSDADEDWFAITATGADVGKVVHVVTTAGDPNTDTFVDVFAADCTTSLGGPGDDSDFHSDFSSTPIQAPGTYFVKVTNSPDGLRGTFYNVSISLE